MARTDFPGISPGAWEHPADRAALAALKKVPGLDQVVKWLIGNTAERQVRLRFLASSVRVNSSQFPKLDTMLSEACGILSAEERPEFYVTQNPVLNAGAVGVNRPFIVLHSSMIDTMSDDEVLAIIGHELGHILSGHALYKTLLAILEQLVKMAGILARIPVPWAVIMAVYLALLEWDRKSELSADRAGLLTVQDLGASHTVLMKLAGGKHLDEMKLNEFVKQAEEYDAGGDIVDSIYKVLNLIGQTHPFPVLRVQALKQWSDGGHYDTILGGTYRKRDDQETEFAEDIKEANQAYQDDLKGSQDPLAKTMADIGEGLESVREEAEKFFGNLFKGGKDE